MPLEMFEGQTGPRLIARPPVADDSYALVVTDKVPQMAVFHPQGLEFNGYPALSPVLDSVPTVVAPMTARRSELLEKFDKAYARLGKARATRTTYTTGSPFEAIALGCAHAIIDLEMAILDNARPVVDKQIICTSIMVGRQLSLKLPKGMFKDVSTIEVGVVQSVEIHNV